MNAVATVTSGLHAALLLARGRADGVVLVPGDRSTVIRSFWSIALCVPSVFCRLLISWTVSGLPKDAAYAAVREIIIFVVGWLIFVELTHRIAPIIGRAERWGRFIALWNWCNVVESLLVVAGGVPGAFGAPAIIDQASELITIGWALWLEWYAVRLALGVRSLTAASLVALDQSIGILLASLALMIGP